MKKRMIRRHVTLPKELSKQITPGKLLSEDEWRKLGIRMSLGWEHYATHKYSSGIESKTIDQSQTFCCFADPWEPMEQQAK